MNNDARIRSEPGKKVFPGGKGLQGLILESHNSAPLLREENNIMASRDHRSSRASVENNQQQDVSTLVSTYPSNDRQHRARGESGIQAFPPYNPSGVDDNTSPPPPPTTTVAASFNSIAPPLPFRPTRTSTPERRLVGPAPPQPEPGASGFPATRLYHRMVTEYETIKTIFYMAKTQPSHNELSPLAARLKFLSREIWNIRYSRAAEFPYSDAVTEERITEWKVQYDYWADVLEDMLDPRYMARTELEKKEEDWAGVAGLASTPGTVAIARKKVNLTEQVKVESATESEPGNDGPVSILKKKKVTIQEDEPPKKKKATKKKPSE
ncbi:hypothetical protein PG990_009419 [Apiospora arundinis]